jgi:hypothetical protein
MTKTTYSITPHVGAKPLLLDMSPSDVESVLGQAQMKSRTFQKELTYDYEFLNVGFDKADRVCHIGFVPGSCVEYDGLSVWTKEAFNWLCILDGSPKEVVGFVVLLSLGLAFTGFHDGDESQKAVSLFAGGRYDDLKPKMRDFVLNAAQ